MSPFAQRHPAYYTAATARADIETSRARRVAHLSLRYALELRERLRPIQEPMEQAARDDELAGPPSCFGDRADAAYEQWRDDECERGAA